MLRKSLILAATHFLMISCGIKGDPVPPVNPVNWGSGLEKPKDVDKDKKENENR